MVGMLIELSDGERERDSFLNTATNIMELKENVMRII
jgi:hypothetical protein